KDMIDLFLETKDVLTEQVAAYRSDEQPDEAAYERICAQLRELAIEAGGGAPDAAPPPQAPDAPAPVRQPQPVQAAPDGSPLCVQVSGVPEKDAESLTAEMALMGTIVH